MKLFFLALLLIAQTAHLAPEGGAALPQWPPPARSTLKNRAEGLRPGDGPHLTGAEKLRPLAPSVRCDDDTMTLRLRGRRDSGVLVDRAGGPPVPVSHLPPHCGFSLRRSRRDLLLVAPYDGCHVSREDGRYVLPLRVHGMPVKMSCPATPRSLATVSCGDSEMVVRVEGASAHEVRVKVSGSWKPLRSVCGQCLCRVDAQRGHLLIRVPYTSVCVNKEEAGPTIRLLTASGGTTLSCSFVPENPAPSPPIHPMFPLHYPVSFYPLFYPTIPSPVSPKYPFLPMNFANGDSKVPPVDDQGANRFSDSVQHIYHSYPFYPIIFPNGYPRVPVGDLGTEEAPNTPSEQHIYPSYQFYPMNLPSGHPKAPLVGDLGATKASSDSVPHIYPSYPFYSVPFNSPPKAPPTGDQDANIPPSLDSVQHIYPSYPFYPIIFPNGYPRVPVGDLDTKEAPNTPSEQHIYPSYPFYPMNLPNSHPKAPLVGNLDATTSPSDFIQHIYPSYPFYSSEPFSNSPPRALPTGAKDVNIPYSTADSVQHFYPNHLFSQMSLPNNGRVPVDNEDASKAPPTPASNHHPYPRYPFYQMSLPSSNPDDAVPELGSSASSTAPSSHSAYGRFPQWYQRPLSVPGSPGKDPLTPSAASSSPNPVGEQLSTYPLYPPYYPMSSYGGRGPEMAELERVTPLATPCPVSQ